MSKSPTHTLQETFDRVATHLLLQGRRAMRSGNYHQSRCAYRGTDNTSCAVGCLISDANYSPDLEGGGVTRQEVAEALQKDGYKVAVTPPGEYPIRHTKMGELLLRLQDVHDDMQDDGENFLPELQRKLRIIAADFDLKG